MREGNLHQIVTHFLLVDGFLIEDRVDHLTGLLKDAVRNFIAPARFIHEAPVSYTHLHTSTKVSIRFIDSTKIEENGTDCLKGLDGILVPGGFGKRGTEGMIQAIEYARVNKIPFLGICLGMQCAVIEFARHVCGLGGANSTELDPGTPHPVVALLTEWKDHSGAVQRRDESSDLGGTMRLGRQEVPVAPNTLAHKI